MKPTLRSTPTGVIVAGDLTVNVIPALVPAGYAVIDKAQEELTFDLSEVTRADSASLALLIDWMRYAKHAHKKLVFSHLPKKVQQMMKLSNLSFG